MVGELADGEESSLMEGIFGHYDWFRERNTQWKLLIHVCSLKEYHTFLLEPSAPMIRDESLRGSAGGGEKGPAATPAGAR
ncbi:hypothetical protein EVAR_23104_1 [Eumeta japonica]|uniref:Uncharacterized protein n=1 Tax=Eumeta variegata TaxID=151549 RepID=A0A4C1VKZ5_EUMVA|nr:hypothetical protein EVAR_23104_1 [Eumeta japonica]